MATQAQKNRIAKLEQRLRPHLSSAGHHADLTIWRQLEGDPALFTLEIEPGPTFTESQMLATGYRSVVVIGDWARCRLESEHAAALRLTPPPARTITVNRPSTISQPKLTVREFSEYVKGD